jgi:hypothetical protein
MKNILEAIVNAGGEPLKVGGCVRDRLLGIQSKDVDIEVYRLCTSDLVSVLEAFGKVNVVGESFGVIKLTTGEDDYDFSLPRKDNKVAPGHKGFEVEVNHELSPAEAAIRRDFTINAIGERLNGELVDPFGGESDLRNRILRATSEHFSEDPLRVLRGFQFASRFQLVAELRTLEMYKELLNEANSLAVERVWGEWEKWANKGVVPSLGLRFLVDSGWIEQHPELVNLIGVPQDPAHHPEGWELLGREFFQLPTDSPLARSAKSIGADGSFATFREFFSSPLAKSAGKPIFASTSAAKSGIDSVIDGFPPARDARSFGSEFPPTFRPAVVANPESLVWSFGSSAIEAGKIVRVMFKIPFNCVHSIVNRTVNDFEVIQAVVQPVAVFVMNMLSAKQFSFQVQFHQDSMDANASPIARPTGVSVSAVVMDATRSAIDGDVLVYYDLRLNGNFDFHNSPVYLPATQYVGELLQKLEEKSSFEVKIGDSWVHTLHVCDAAAKICDREGVEGENRVIIVLAALCHDLGKALPENGGTTVFEDGRWRSPGHDEAGVPLSRKFLERIGCFERIIEKVLPLVREHMICMVTSEINERVVRRLSVRLGKASMKELLFILEADYSGRPPLPGGLPEPAKEIAVIAERLALEAAKPKPIIGGRHLIALGQVPGVAFGDIISKCFEAQLDGVFTDEVGGCAFLEKLL